LKTPREKYYENRGSVRFLRSLSHGGRLKVGTHRLQHFVAKHSVVKHFDAQQKNNVKRTGCNILKLFNCNKIISVHGYHQL